MKVSFIIFLTWPTHFFIAKRPLGDKKMRWPGQENYEGYFHDLFPSWKEFWSSEYIRDNDVAKPVEANSFLQALRRDSKPGKLRVK